MAKYLIDVNLPRYFSLWNSPDYLFVSDINDEWTDEEIWNYATLNELTIVTKDADFSERIWTLEPPPKVIHMRIGNVTMREFHRIVSKSWDDCCSLSQNHKLVQVFDGFVEAIE